MRNDLPKLFVGPGMLKLDQLAGTAKTRKSGGDSRATTITATIDD